MDRTGLEFHFVFAKTRTVHTVIFDNIHTQLVTPQVPLIPLSVAIVCVQILRDLFLPFFQNTKFFVPGETLEQPAPQRNSSASHHIST